MTGAGGVAGGKSGTVLGVISRPRITAVAMPMKPRKADQRRSDAGLGGAVANTSSSDFVALVTSSVMNIHFTLHPSLVDLQSTARHPTHSS